MKSSADDRLVQDSAFYVRVQKSKLIVTVMLLVAAAFANGWFGL
jgi:hypothetical protein